LAKTGETRLTAMSTIGGSTLATDLTFAANTALLCRDKTQ
jgi:hypothetical protein